jgi:hypothetical protein
MSVEGRTPAAAAINEVELLAGRSTAGNCFGHFIDFLLLAEVQWAIRRRILLSTRPPG